MFLLNNSQQRQYGDVVYAKDVSEDDKRREVRDKARLEKECERLREELQEERLVSPRYYSISYKGFVKIYCKY